MCCLRHPQNRWYDRRIQPRPNHSAGGNSERETEDTPPPSYTRETRKSHLRCHQEQCQPQHVRHHLHGLKTRKTKGSGHTGTYVPHSRDGQPAETALSQGEHQDPHQTTVQRITDLPRKSQELMTCFPAGAEGSRDPPASVSPCSQLAS